jgi:hypothetical protein
MEADEAKPIFKFRPVLFPQKGMTPRSDEILKTFLLLPVLESRSLIGIDALSVQMQLERFVFLTAQAASGEPEDLFYFFPRLVRIIL